MIAKSLIAAAAVGVSVLAFAPAEANAKTNWDIHIGLGAPIYDAPVYSYDYDYEYEPVRVPRRHYVYRYANPVYYNDRMSCRGGQRVVRSAGFHGVEAYDCGAPNYGYTAWKHGDLFRVRVNYSGDIISVRQMD
jgi:hypothetical protein